MDPNEIVPRQVDHKISDRKVNQIFIALLGHSYSHFETWMSIIHIWQAHTLKPSTYGVKGGAPALNSSTYSEKGGPTP